MRRGASRVVCDNVGNSVGTVQESKEQVLADGAKLVEKDGSIENTGLALGYMETIGSAAHLWCGNRQGLLE